MSDDASLDWVNSKNYRKHKFSSRTYMYFHGQASPRKLNTRNFVHKKISNSNYDGLLLPMKINLHENFIHEIL